MATHVAGRDSNILTEIRSGTKSIEARLGKPRFRAFKPGNHIKIREDVWENGKIVKSQDSGLETVVTKVETYLSFREMFVSVGFKNVSPQSKNLEDALAEVYRFYSPEDEQKLGVVAIHFKLAD